MRTPAVLFALSVCCAIWAGDVCAQQGLPTDPTQVPVEYSNLFDERALGCVHDGLEPQQVLYTEPLDLTGCPFVRNSFDFNGPGAGFPEVDALANCQDRYFLQIPTNLADLLISFEDDAPNPPGVAVYYERPGGGTGSLWRHVDLCNGGGGLDGSIEDVDALELWGQLDTDDANMFSLEGEPGGVSVWSYLGDPPAVGIYMWQTTIWGAVESLGFEGNPTDADVDAMMLFDADCEGTWSSGDWIVFSIRAAANWDGGEIVVLSMGGAAAFLNHGGHLWDTAFGVAGTFLVGTEEVDGIEAAADVDILPMERGVPSMSKLGLLIMAILVLGVTAALIWRRLRLGEVSD